MRIKSSSYKLDARLNSFGNFHPKWIKDGSKDKGSFALGMKGSECEVGRPWQDRILHLDFIDLCIDDDDQNS